MRHSWIPTRPRGGARASLGGLSALLLVLALTPTLTRAEVYQQIRIALPIPSHVLELLAAEGLEFMGDEEDAYLFLARGDETERLLAAGVELEVQVEDLETFYRERLIAERAAQGPVAGGGNFGIFHTYDETYAELQALHAEFPAITTAPFSIGQSIEGREIWALKVSDNPLIDEDEGEILFDGVHHAREIMTVEMLLDFSRYLCENYGVDPVVTQIVESREVYFVPIVNPDGFVYNELTNPAGGGMWRKNRRDNPNSNCWGVDLNRNYDFQWVGSGSSTDPCEETFRGAAPNSEPEIQAHTAFIDSRDFIVWQSYHSVAGMVLFPWGYTFDHTPDDATFRTMAAEMARDSEYVTGQAPEILYNVNGAAFDWGYGATAQHEKIFAFTTEIDGSGFWPLESERDGLIAENLSSNLYLCKVGGVWVDLGDLAVSDAGNGRLDPGEAAELLVTVVNPSILVDATNVTATLRSDDPYVLVTDATSVIGTVPKGEMAAGTPFSVSVDPACPDGRSVSLTVELAAEGGFRNSGSVELVVGQSTIISQQDFESGPQGWSTDPSHTASTGAFVSVDPNPTAFQPGDDTTPAPGVRAWITGQNSSLGVDDVDAGVAATRSPVVDLSGRPAVRLRLDYFFGQRDPGTDSGDFFRLSLSNDGGSTFPVHLVSIGDQYSEADWHTLVVDVEDLLPLTSQMMLRVQAADGTANGDIVEAGIDDVYWYENGTGNEAPAAPQPLAPPDGAENVPASPTLVVANAVDPDGDDLTYGFRVWSDAELTQLVAETAGVAEGALTTSWTVEAQLQQGETYYWRAYAADDEVLGSYSTAWQFTVGDVTNVSEISSTGADVVLAGPSPSSGTVRIRYHTQSAVDADLDVFDASGRKIRSLPAARWSEGWQEAEWDGRDAEGRKVPAGIYWVRLRTADAERAVRVVRIE